MVDTTADPATNEHCSVRKQRQRAWRKECAVADLIRYATLFTLLLVSPVGWMASDCDHLCSVERGDQRLGDFLLPLQNNPTFEGCVVAMAKTPAVNAPTLTFSYDEFISATRRPWGGAVTLTSSSISASTRGPNVPSCAG